jgi:glycerol-3-phosphate cytidylyltransferase
MKRYKHGITFGAFDPLHYGHIRLFVNAKQHCDHLTVCVSDKKYIQKNKDREERIPLQDRITAVANIRAVDKVGVQSLEGATKKDHIKTGDYDVIFVGDDWTPDTFTGEGLGVPVEYLSHTVGISSTQLVTKKQ